MEPRHKKDEELHEGGSLQAFGAVNGVVTARNKITLEAKEPAASVTRGRESVQLHATGDDANEGNQKLCECNGRGGVATGTDARHEER